MEVEVIETTCASCGVVFGIASHMEKQRRDDGANFHCPNGHILVYNKGKSKLTMLTEDVERLTKENAALKREVESLKFEVSQAKAPKREIHLDSELPKTEKIEKT